MLHTVNKSPYEKDSFDTCLSYCQSGNSVLLIEDGVYAAINHSEASKKIISMTDVTFYALDPDLKARGIDASRLVDTVKLIDYDGFVDLVTEKSKVQAWL